MASTIAKKMSRIAGQVGYLQKGGYNDAQSYSYLSAAQVLLALNPLLAEEGISTTVECRDMRTMTREGRSGTIIDAFVLLRVTFTDSETGESLSSDGQGQGSDRGDKAVMKATTAAYKYALTGAFQIASGDDPEADTSVDKEGYSAPPEKAAVEAPSKPPRARREPKATTPPPITEEALLMAITVAETASQMQELVGHISAYKAAHGEANPDAVGRVVAAFKTKMKARTQKETTNG